MPAQSLYLTSVVRLVALCLFGGSWVAAAAPPVLSLPIGCAIGRGCQVQNYPDNLAGPSVGDYDCGRLSYDGHKGTDIRLRDAAALASGVKVLAAAEGRVKGVRNDMADASIRDAGTREVSGRECGNGVVVEHGDGWVTQYCHLKRGSVRVKPGAAIERGAVLGEVGLSGFTEFAHLHFEVRKGASIIDPFTGEELSSRATNTCGPGQDAMWDRRAAAALFYKPAALLDGGFAAGAVDLAALEASPPAAPTAHAPALLAFVRVIGVRAGDVEMLTVEGPGGAVFVGKGPLSIAASKVQWLSFAGRRRTSVAWPTGRYNARYRLERDGRVILDERFGVEISR
jgi:Peptidase family M23